MTHSPTPTELSEAERELQRGFDAWHTARAGADLLHRLYAEALGDNYPVEVAAFSSCDWTVLATAVAHLRMRPGQILADLGCGTGGAGLWLARALTVRLAGIDISPTALTLAARRRPQFVETQRADFRVGTLTATGLPDQSVHGAVCIDALSFATDRDAALTEIHRILHPGGRAVLTRALPRGADPADQASRAGLILEHLTERPDEPDLWRRLYHLWTANETELRQTLGDEQAKGMLAEATRMQPRLATRRAVIMTVRRPVPPGQPIPSPTKPEADEGDR